MISDKKIPLMEMFGPTIQGEGAVIGQQTYFMRFGLCDYRCKMCDSMFAVLPASVKANGRQLTQHEILSEFLTFHKPNSTPWVTFSGGNPCIHDLGELVSALGLSGFKIVVETQGTLAPYWLHDVDIITVSPKGPGMGENTDVKVLSKFMETLRPVWHKVCFKIVVFDQRDLEFAKAIYELFDGSGIPFYLSLGNPYPPDTTEPREWSVHMAELVGRYKMLFEDIQTDPILSTMRFLPQWHTFVWGNEKGK